MDLEDETPEERQERHLGAIETPLTQWVWGQYEMGTVVSQEAIIRQARRLHEDIALEENCPTLNPPVEWLIEFKKRFEFFDLKKNASCKGPEFQRRITGLKWFMPRPMDKSISKLKRKLKQTKRMMHRNLCQKRVTNESQTLQIPKVLVPKLQDSKLLYPKLLDSKLLEPKLLDPKLLDPKLSSLVPRVILERIDMSGYEETTEKQNDDVANFLADLMKFSESDIMNKPILRLKPNTDMDALRYIQSIDDDMSNYLETGILDPTHASKSLDEIKDKRTLTSYTSTSVPIEIDDCVKNTTSNESVKYSNEISTDSTIPEPIFSVITDIVIDQISDDENPDEISRFQNLPVVLIKTLNKNTSIPHDRSILNRYGRNGSLIQRQKDNPQMCKNQNSLSNIPTSSSKKEQENVFVSDLKKLEVSELKQKTTLGDCTIDNTKTVLNVTVKAKSQSDSKSKLDERFFQSIMPHLKNIELYSNTPVYSKLKQINK